MKKKSRLRPLIDCLPLALSSVCGIMLLVPAHAEYADENFAQTRNSPVLGLRAESLSNVIRRFVELKQRLVDGEEIELPLVSVTVANRTLTGKILDCQNAEVNPVMVMETKEGEGRFNSTRIVYLRVNDIAALEIHDTWSKQVQATLELGPPDALPAPTKIDLKRKMANFSTWLSESSGRAISYTMDLSTLPANDDLLRAISSVMNETTSGVSEILRNSPENAKELKSVAFALGKESGAKFASGILYVTIDERTPRKYKRGVLSQQIKQTTQKN